MASFFAKLGSRSKLQVAILILLLIIVNRYFNLGLSADELTKAVSGLVAYILAEGYKDAHNTTPPSNGKEPAN